MTAPGPVAEFLWIDLETTGLIPGAGRILEWAVVLCEDSRAGDFEVVEAYSSPVHYSIADLASLQADGAIKPEVVHMHTKNDLWTEVEQSTTTLAESEAFLVDLCERLAPGRKAGITIAGASVHFDLAWLSVWMPAFKARISHRVFDVSTLRRAADSWAPAPIAWTPRASHRALPDIYATIGDARIARAAMGWGLP